MKSINFAVNLSRVSITAIEIILITVLTEETNISFEYTIPYHQTHFFDVHCATMVGDDKSNIRLHIMKPIFWCAIVVSEDLSMLLSHTSRDQIIWYYLCFYLPSAGSLETRTACHVSPQQLRTIRRHPAFFMQSSSTRERFFLYNKFAKQLSSYWV